MSPAEVAILLKKMDNAFYMIDAQGNRKKLLDIGKVVDGLKLSRKSAGKDAYDRAMEGNTQPFNKSTLRIA